MEYDNNLQGALWLKEAASGQEYYTGPLEIDGVVYWVSMFDERESKRSERAPDFRLKLKIKDEKNVKNVPF